MPVAPFCGWVQIRYRRPQVKVDTISTCEHVRETYITQLFPCFLEPVILVPCICTQILTNEISKNDSRECDQEAASTTTSKTQQNTQMLAYLHRNRSLWVNIFISERSKGRTIVLSWASPLYRTYFGPWDPIFADWTEIHEPLAAMPSLSPNLALKGTSSGHQYVVKRHSFLRP